MIADVLSVVVLYVGFGFLLSRFWRSPLRNLPVTWLVLTVFLLPPLLSFLAAVLPLQHGGALTFSALALFAGIVSEPWFRLHPRWRVAIGPPLRRIHPVELLVWLGVFLLFLILLIQPKFTLIRSVSPSILDDVNNIHKVLSAGFNLDPPMYFQMPFLRLNYYYFDYLLPAIVFRTTSLSAQGALLLHNALEYVAVLSCFLYIAGACFSRIPARILFLLGATFVGGLDYFVYWWQGNVPGHVEWWMNDLPFPKDFTAQISSFYTLFLWVPQHLMAGTLFLFILILLPQQRTVTHRFVLAVLFAALLGFSAFVFITAALAFIAAEVLLLHRQPLPRVLWRWLPLHAAVFLLLAADVLLLYLQRTDTMLFFDPKVIHFLSAPVDGAPWFLKDLLTFLQDALNFLGTMSLFLLLDCGIVGVLGVLFLCSRRGREGWRQGSPGLPFYAAVSVAVIFLFLGFASSINYNDLFMRGIIPAQMALLLAAGLFLETQQRWRRTVSVLALLLIPAHLPATYTEWKGRSDFARGTFDHAYQFLQKNTPKSSIIFTDTDLCGDITYRANRVCVNNMDQVDRQYAVPPPADRVNYHDPRAMQNLVLDRPAYFVTREQKDIPGFWEVYGNDGFHIYLLSTPFPLL